MTLLKLTGHFSHPDWDGMLEGTAQPLEVIVAVDDETISDTIKIHEAAGPHAVLVLPGENEELCILQRTTEKGAWLGVPGEESINLLARGIRTTSAGSVTLHVDSSVHHLRVVDRGWDPSAWTGQSDATRYEP